MGNYAGVDWASEKHDVLVQDEAGEELLAATFAHDEEGLRSLCRTLVRMKVSWSRSSGRTGCWSSGCWTPGCGCWRCIPTRSRRRAPRFRASGGKSDRFDAFVLCELARTDHHRFRVLEPDSDQTKALRALTRAREDLVQDQGGAEQPAARRARALLARPDRPVQRSRQPDLARVPGALPQPADAQVAGREAPGRVPDPPALQRPQASQRAAGQAPAAPEGRAGELEGQARRAARARAGRGAQAARRPDQAARAADRHRDPRAPRRRDLPLAVPRPGEASSPPPRCWPRSATAARATPPRDALAGDAGQAAVAIESGKRKIACFRWACNKRLRDAFCTLADSTRHWHPWAADHYARAIAPRPRPPPRRPAPSAAPGAASCGAAGRPAPPTTRPATAPCNSTSW